MGWYYYVHKTRHSLYIDWYKPLDEIESPAIKKAIGQFLIFSPKHAMISPTRKAEALNIAYEGVSQQKARIEACQSAIANISMSEFAGIDLLMNQQVTESIATNLLKISPKALDEMITQRIMDMDIETENDDSILIPVYSV